MFPQTGTPVSVNWSDSPSPLSSLTLSSPFSLHSSLASPILYPPFTPLLLLLFFLSLLLPFPPDLLIHPLTPPPPLSPAPNPPSHGSPSPLSSALCHSFLSCDYGQPFLPNLYFVAKNGTKKNIFIVVPEIIVF